MHKLAVVAIGGNSLIRNEAHQTVPDQWEAIGETCGHLAAMIAAGWDIVITHGNGPQVGFALLRAELASDLLHPVPLDLCVADTQGSLGYMIQQALRNNLLRLGIRRSIVTVVTQVLVDRDDPAFLNPTKPVGPFLTRERAEQYRKEGKAVMEDAGRGWRRVVPSPRPREILEMDAIRALQSAGFLIIAAGGGGIPVICEEGGALKGVEAVIDKDFTASLLAIGLRADLFLISTAVDQVAIHYRTPQERWLTEMTVDEARRYLHEGHFPPGSMGPKIEAAIQYLEAGGKMVLITSPSAIGKALEGEAGTRILP
ncbi:MAG: carbamate kinase [Armatimonadota bacterium]|nr:carbamate kinase [Armatimonadota bacterium]MDR5701997.1 carbamate kinase [Armatimonadota bacterium]